jgi:glutathione S-transferase
MLATALAVCACQQGRRVRFTTLAALVTDGGEVLSDSTDILRWADARMAPWSRLYPHGQLGAEASALEASLDDGFGPAGRLWRYHETLPVVRRLQPWALAGIPQWERVAFRASSPLLGAVIRRYLGVDADASREALDLVDRVFEDIAARLSDGRRFVLGDGFTAADLTFAALAAPVLLPERYGSPLPSPAMMPSAVAREVDRLRNHPAGVFAERLYREERVRADSPKASA